MSKCTVINKDETLIQKEFKVKDFNCQECSKLISNEVKYIEQGKFSLNIEKGTLTIIAKKKSDFEQLISKISSIISSHHPSINLDDKNYKKLSYKISSLDCASCAAKIESRVSNLDEVSFATIDFAKSEIDIEINEEVNEQRLVKKISQIIKEIEPDAKLVIDEDEEHNHKSNYLVLGRIIVSSILLILGMIFKSNQALVIVFSLLSYLIIGYDVLLRSLRNIVRGQVFDENFLMSIATIGALALGEYSEAVAVMLFYQVGEYFQHLSVERSRKSISDLMNIKENYASVLVNNEEVLVNVEDVKVGDIIIVKPGGKVPLDGKIISGHSYLDLSSLNGESMPKEVSINDEVLSGSINQNSVLTIKVSKIYEDSTIARIFELVESATKRKAKSESFITKFAKYYTPIVVISALLIFLIPVIFFQGSINEWLYRALVFLVISCPCALVISIPLSFYAGIGASSKLGILVKGGNYLEALNEVKTIVFDKTGTLTKGEFKVTNINPMNISKDELLMYAAYGEAYSNHPLARAIKNAYQDEINLSKIDHYEERPGLGTKVVIDGKEVLLGNKRILDKDIHDEEGTLIHVVVNNEYVGNIVLEDELKSNVKETINDLYAFGINKTIMLTGDKENVASKIASSINLNEYKSNLLPQQKVEALEKIKKENNGKVVYVGDGINDAPVLALSDIGISMGKLGSDAAIEASDIVIMSDEPHKIVTALKLAKRTRGIVLFNIIFAIGVKLFFLILGALGFATMWEAVFADVGVSLIAILNATRLLNIKKLKD